MTTATGKTWIGFNLALSALLFCLRAMNTAGVAAVAATAIWEHGRLSRRLPLLVVLATWALW